jgi:hypothetical protein
MQHKWLMIPAIGIIVFLSSCGTSGNTSSKQVGTWQQTPVVIDGKNNDWPAPYPFYDYKSHLSYAISNDKDNLYITVEAGDQITMTKLLRQGFVVYVDPTSGKDQSKSIAYPMPSSEAETKWSKQTPGDMRETEATKQNRIVQMMKMVDESHGINITGFKGSCNGILEVKQKNDCGIVTAMDIDEYGSLVWEVKLPFKAFYKEQLVQADNGKVMQVCLATTGFKNPVVKTAPQGGGGSAGMPGMNGGRGGMNRGASSRADDSRELLFQSTKTWVNIPLVYKP